MYALDVEEMLLPHLSKGFKNRSLFYELERT